MQIIAVFIDSTCSSVWGGVLIAYHLSNIIKQLTNRIRQKVSVSAWQMITILTKNKAFSYTYITIYDWCHIFTNILFQLKSMDALWRWSVILWLLWNGYVHRWVWQQMEFMKICTPLVFQQLEVSCNERHKLRVIYFNHKQSIFVL